LKPTERSSNVAYRLCTAEVRGSTPLGSTFGMLHIVGRKDDYFLLVFVTAASFCGRARMRDLHHRVGLDEHDIAAIEGQGGAENYMIPVCWRDPNTITRPAIEMARALASGRRRGIRASKENRSNSRRA
jgi:hypothetical protein